MAFAAFQWAQMSLYRFKLAVIGGLLVFFLFLFLYFFYFLLAFPPNLALAPYIVISPFRSLEPAWAAYALAGGAALALAVYGYLGSNLSTATRWVAFSLAALVGAALIVAAMQASRVADRAEAIAGGAPYCIQVADRMADYRPASTLLDLSGLTMWASEYGGRFMQHHAVLAVGQAHSPRLFNWSYRKRNWVEVESRRAEDIVVRCRSRVEFARSLPILVRDPRNGELAHFRVFGRSFEIPLIRHPSAGTGGGLHLSFNAAPPEFAPPAQPCDTPYKCILDQVIVYFRPQPLLSWLNSSGRTRVFINDGPARTNIECSSPSPKGTRNCTHVFLHDDWLYSLQYNEVELPQWKLFQERLVGLVRSFQTQGALP